MAIQKSAKRWDGIHVWLTDWPSPLEKWQSLKLEGSFVGAPVSTSSIAIGPMFFYIGDPESRNKPCFLLDLTESCLTTWTQTEFVQLI